VTFPLPVDDPKPYFDSVNALIAAGFLVDQPGVGEGKKVEEVDHVMRKEASDGTPVVAFYSTNVRLTGKLAHKYLNTPEDVMEFERASGLKLAAIPLYDGNDFLRRDDNKAAKYIIRAATTFKIVMALTDQYKAWASQPADSRAQQSPQKYFVEQYISGGAKPAAATSEPTATTRVRPPVADNVNIYQAVVDAGLAENVHAARKVLDRCKTGYNTPEKAIAFMRLYRGHKDSGKDTEAAIELANSGVVP